MSENTAPAVNTELAEIASVEDATIAGSSAVELVKNFASNNAPMTTSIKGGSLEERMSVLAAINDSEKLKANIGKIIWLQNFVLQAIEMPDEATGVLNSVPRVTLIDKDGDAFAAISASLAQGLELLVMMATERNPQTGEVVTEWNANPIPVIVKEITTRRGFTAFNLVPAKKSDIAREEAIAEAEAKSKK